MPSGQPRRRRLLLVRRRRAAPGRRGGGAVAVAAAAGVRLPLRPPVPHLGRPRGRLPGRMGRRPRHAPQGRLRPLPRPPRPHGPRARRQGSAGPGRPRHRAAKLPQQPARQPGPGRGPRLDLSPRRLMLGALRAGEQRQVRITISNKGKGVLQGKVRVSEGERLAQDRRAWTASASCRSRRPAIRRSRSASRRAACRPAGPTAPS